MTARDDREAAETLETRLAALWDDYVTERKAHVAAIERFAASIREDERRRTVEECAKVADEFSFMCNPSSKDKGERDMRAWCDDIARMIRALIAPPCSVCSEAHPDDGRCGGGS